MSVSAVDNSSLMAYYLQADAAKQGVSSTAATTADFSSMLNAESTSDTTSLLSAMMMSGPDAFGSGEDSSGLFGSSEISFYVMLALTGMLQSQLSQSATPTQAASGYASNQPDETSSVEESAAVFEA